LTVLFCDLVGSTELSRKLDPEDMSALIRAYQETVAAQLARFEGHVAKFMGDGVLAYFGWPKAHEDDAERAVRAGLAVAEAVGHLSGPGGAPLAARVGIATGQVVVGDLIGEGAAQEEAVVGETPNLAARLQALAGPGAMVISQATRRLVGGLFELADLGPQRLKGFAEPLAAFRVEGEGRAEGRFEALHGQRLTPLIGREHELGLLLERWRWARDGDGQVVLIAGEPGIGKSRLVRALRGRRSSIATRRRRDSWPGSRRCSPARASGWTRSCPCSPPCSGCRPGSAIRR
jgi:class 3 adenylate cyclase